MEELEQLLEQINQAEEHLKELKREYHDKKMSGLRSAIQARQEADKMIQEELRSMGYKQYNPIPLHEWRNFRA